MNPMHRDLETAAASRRVKTEAVRPEEGVGSMARAFPEVERVLQAAGVAFLELNYDARAGHGEFTTVRCIGPDGKSMSWLLPAALRQEVCSSLEGVIRRRYPKWTTLEGSCGRFVWDLSRDVLEHRHSARYIEYETWFFYGL